MIPVFIGGCARSGTTLLGAMLGTHSDCLCIPESPFKVDVYLSIRGLDKVHFIDVLNKIKNLPRFKIWGLDIETDSVLHNEISTYPEVIEWIIKKYAEKVGKSTPTMWVDHTPTNINHPGILFELFPKAKMIHIVRDGRAVADSIMPLDWGPNTVDRAAHFWMKRVVYGLTAEDQWRERVIRIRYEDLVREPEKTLKDICSYLEIDYQPEMVKGTGFKVPLYTVKQHLLVGQRPDAKQADLWEKTLTPRQIEIFESIAGALLLSLGYTLNYGLKAKRMTTMERLILNNKEKLRRNIVNKVCHWYRYKKGIAIASKKS